MRAARASWSRCLADTLRSGSVHCSNPHKHSIDDILRESLSHEREALGVYYQLLAVSEGRFVLLEEYAREMIADEELHVDAVKKMLRAPGDIAPYASS